MCKTASGQSSHCDRFQHCAEQDVDWLLVGTFCDDVGKQSSFTSALAFIRKFTARFAFTGWRVPTKYSSKAAVRQIFSTIYDAYKQFAFGHDELLPVSLGGGDDLGGWGASLVDALGLREDENTWHTSPCTVYAVPLASPHLTPLSRPSPDALSALLTLTRPSASTGFSRVGRDTRGTFQTLPTAAQDHLSIAPPSFGWILTRGMRPSKGRSSSMTVAVSAFACPLLRNDLRGNCVLDDDECVQEGRRSRGQGKGNGARLRWQSLGRSAQCLSANFGNESKGTYFGYPPCDSLVRRTLKEPSPSLRPWTVLRMCKGRSGGCHRQMSFAIMGRLHIKRPPGQGFSDRRMTVR
ncbi:hypothetical protein FB45DRAFT_882660 [Roridomyces roridus]|uniref:Uncharacterized protein n=1 Tax=Roridomyces roridus TaxID=1738132 RepID=A0AAD7AY15_9AGAR|nr:hypothetical protein FB45DRAFT_882660 [Roridomyces roridus]